MPVDGILWSTKIYFPNHGIIIEASTRENSMKAIILVLLYGMGAMLILRVFQKESLEKVTRDLVYRTNLIALYFTILHTVTITFLLVFTTSTYLLHSQGIGIKMLYYPCLVLPIGLSLISCAVLMGAFVRILRKTFPDPIVSMSIFLLAFLLLLGYPFLICYWPKSEWYLVYSTIPINLQFLHSLVVKRFPNYRFLFFSIWGVLFMMAFQSIMPMMHFTQLTWWGICKVLSVIGIELFMGILAIRIVIGREIVEMVEYHNSTKDSMQELEEPNDKGKGAVSN